MTGVIITEAAGYTSSIFLLNYLWYQYYDQTKFHSFNDNAEWLQMDKFGHTMTSYYLGNVGYKTLRWAGVNKKKSLWYGATLGSFYLLSMEVLDGFSSDWGFSTGDIAANTLGTAAFMLQEHFWDEQRIKFKVSAHLSPYASYRPNVLGNNTPERLMKDYNGQTYWMSVNIGSFLKKKSKFPAWLNIAAGYGGEEMISGRPEDAGIYQSTFNRYRQFYLSPDIDLTKIKVSKPWLKPVLHVLDMIKIPMPTLEFNKHGIQGHWIYF